MMTQTGLYQLPVRVGRVVNLRPIGNRPFAGNASPDGPIANLPNSAASPQLIFSRADDRFSSSASGK
jgi:hypothetical protein